MVTTSAMARGRLCAVFATLGAGLSGCLGSAPADHVLDGSLETGTPEAASGDDATVDGPAGGDAGEGDSGVGDADAGTPVAEAGPVCVDAGAVCGTNMTCSASGTCGCVAGDSQCSATVCANFQTDGANCGRCGHSCGGGTCSGGKCTQWTFAASPVVGNVTSLVTDGKYVLWTDQGLQSVLQLPISGGTSPVVIAKNAAFSTISDIALAFGGTRLAWVGTNGLWTGTENAPGSGAFLDITTFPSLDLGDLAVNTDGTHIGLFNNQTGSSGFAYDLYDCTIASATCKDIEEIGYYPSGGVANASSYFFNDLSDNAVEAINFGSAVVNTIEPGSSGPAGIAVDAKNNLYWIGGANIVTGSVLGGPITTLASLPDNATSVSAIATDGNYVYVTTSGSPSVVAYTPVSGPPTVAVPLAQGLTGPMTAGGGFVFWLDGSSSINAIAAP